jgi:hypothetical protein
MGRTQQSGSWIFGSASFYKACLQVFQPKCCLVLLL